MKRYFAIVASLLIMACLAFAGVAMADDGPKTKGLTVTPARGTASIWTERPEYRVGDPVRIYFKSTVDGYAAIYNYSSDGSSQMVWPRNGQASSIKANRTYSIPDGNGSITASEPTGTDTLVLVVSQARQNLSFNLNLNFIFGNKGRNDGNATATIVGGDDDFTDRISAQCSFRVLPKFIDPVLTISGGNGARVFVDGNDYGSTGQVTLSPGKHQVVVLLPGFKAEVKEFDMVANRNYTMWVRFSRVGK